VSFSNSVFDDVRALYNDSIRRHGRTPSHAGPLPGFDGQARGTNPMCGDRVDVYVRRDGNRVAAAGFEARGCEVSVASADLMCEVVAGVAVDHISSMAERVATLAASGICPDCDARLLAFSAVHEFPSRVRCVTLPWSALMVALQESSRE